MLEIQIFVGVVVILGAVFVALLCDFLKGNNEQLRERNIELTSRQDEREKLGIFQNPMEWMQNLVSALRQTPMAESMAGAGTPPPASRETEAFTPLRKNGESDIAAGEAEPPLRRRMYDEMKARSQQGPSWASKEELEQLAERAARIRARHEAHKTHDDKVKEDTATRLVEEVARQRETPEPVEHSAAPEPLPVIVPPPVPEKAPVVLEKTPIVLEKPQVVPDIPAPVVEKAAPVVEKAPVVIEKAPVIIDKAPIVMERPPAPVEIKPPVVESAKVTPIKPPERPVERDLPSMPREQVIPSGPFAAAPAREPAPPAAPKPAPSLWDDEASEDEPPPVILSPASAVTGSRPALSLSIPAMPEPPAPPKPPAPEIIDEVARLKVLPIETIGLEPVPPPPPAPPSVELAFEPEPEPEPAPEVKPEPEAKPEPVERPVASVPSPPPPPPPVTLPVAAAAPVLQAQADPVEYDEVPAGLHEGSVLESLIERGLSFSGVAVAIGINDYASLKEKLAANSGADSLSALNRMVQSMLRPQDFACQFTEDEFILLYPGESGSSAQRRLFQVSEKLWDFQLRSLGHLSVMFSWGGLEVQNERLQEAVASARERMYQTRRNRKPGAGESAGARKRVANG